MNKLVNYKWKIGFYILLVVSLIIIGLCIYSMIDQAVTLTYTDVSLDDLENDIKILESIIPELSKSLDKKDILYLLRKQNPTLFIAENDSEINISQIIFKFKSNKLVLVKKL